MKLLLDSHAIVWFIEGSALFSKTALRAIIDLANESFISPVTAWELAIKSSIGKLTLQTSLDDFIDLISNRSGLKPLQISAAHIKAVARLPLHHRDPFDRMLIAQATVEGMTLISSDGAIDAYGLQRIW